MTKIYLAKSNQANPDDVYSVRKYLERFSDSIQIIEHNGGSYSNKELLTCDGLIIIPNLTDFEVDDSNVVIGKGLYQQMDDFEQKNKSTDEIWVVVNVNSERIIGSGVYQCGNEDEDDYINYAELELDEENEEMENWLKSRFRITEQKKNKLNNFMYLLI